MGWWDDFLYGSPAKYEQISNLRPEQEQTYQGLQSAAQGYGAPGAFGTAADYYRNLMGNNPADFQAFAAPSMQQYYQDIVPGISEQFAGMGSGGLSSSGFRNAQTQAGTDLAERLGALRAQLRQQGAQGLFGIGQAALGPYSQLQQTQGGSSGFLPGLGALAGYGISAGIGGAFGGPQGALAGAGAYGTMQGQNTSPYGHPPPATNPYSERYQ